MFTTPYRRAARAGALLALFAGWGCSDHAPTPTTPALRFDAALAPTSSMFQGDPTAAPAPTTATPLASPFPCQGGESVLLIQDNVPWFAPADQNPNGADVTELLAQNKSFCMIGSGDIGTTNLAPFSEIVIAAAQTTAFYNNLFPNGVVHPAISAYVQGGGVLSANLTDCAGGLGNGGTWGTAFCDATENTSFTFVGGVKHANFFTQDNDITAPSHPIITDGLTCPGGNCAAIVDVGFRNDLDGWNFSSHGVFLDLPSGTTVILQTAPEGFPVTIEYPFGSGRVIATLTTTEWRYAVFEHKKLLANDIAYQDFIAVLPVEIDIKPGGDPTNPINIKSQGMIPVAVLGSATFDATTIDPTSVRFGPGQASPTSGGHVEDVNGDGIPDMVFQFNTQASGLSCGDTSAKLTGKTQSGRRFAGTDVVTIIGCPH